MVGIHNALVGFARKGGFDGFVFNQTISAHTANYNLKSAAIAAGWNQTDKLQANIIVNSGIYISATGTSSSSYAFDTGVTFPSGSELKLVNNGIIAGRGGNGGQGGGSIA